MDRSWRINRSSSEVEIWEIGRANSPSKGLGVRTNLVSWQNMM